MSTPFPFSLTSNPADFTSEVENHPERFEEAIQIILSNKNPVSWKVAWRLEGVIEVNDKRVRNHVKKLLQLIPNANSSLQREVLKILLKMNIQEDQQGELYNHCVDTWKNLKMQPGTRYYAFRMLLKIVDQHPELKSEVLTLAEPHYIQSLSPGIGKSITKLVSELVGQ